MERSGEILDPIAGFRIRPHGKAHTLAAPPVAKSLTSLSRIPRTNTIAFGVYRYIANLGHGMHPTHEPEKLRVFVDAVHEVSKRLNAK